VTVLEIAVLAASGFAAGVANAIAGDLVWWPPRWSAAMRACCWRRISETTVRAIIVTAGTVLTIVFLLK
jgi:hypothetical protein